MASTPKKSGVVQPEAIPTKVAVLPVVKKSLKTKKEEKTSQKNVQNVPKKNEVQKTPKTPPVVVETPILTPEKGNKKEKKVTKKNAPVAVVAKNTKETTIKDKKSETNPTPNKKTPLSEITALLRRDKKTNIKASSIEVKDEVKSKKTSKNSINTIPVFLQKTKKESEKSITITTSGVHTKVQKAKTVSALDPSEGVIVSRKSFLPMIPSPFRLPALPTERQVAMMTRVLGIFFLVMGSLFSLVQVPAIADILGVQQIATTLDATDPNLINTNQTITGDTVGTTIISPDMNTKPNPTITTDKGTQLTGIVHVTVSLPVNPSVDMVNLVIEDMGHTSSVPMVMSSQGAGVWQVELRTAERTNGEYRFMVYIKNAYGTYMYNDTTVYSISNTVSPDTQSGVITTPTQNTQDVSNTGTVNTVNTALPTDTATLLNTNSLNLHINESSPLSEGVDMTIQGHEVDKVRVYARNTKTYTSYFVGYATHGSGDEWTLTWNSRNVYNGEYVIMASANKNGAEIQSQKITVKVDNELATIDSGAVASSTTPKVPTVPKVSVKFSKNNTFSGFVDVYAETTDDVEALEFYALPKSSLEPRYIGAAKKIFNQKWKYTWDTRQTPNGEYGFYVKSKTAYGYTDGASQTVRVFNEAVQKLTDTQEAAIDVLNQVDKSLIHITDGLSKDAVKVEKEEKNQKIDAVATDKNTNQKVENLEKKDEQKEDKKPVDETKLVYIQPVDSFIKTIDTNTTEKENIKSLLVEFRARLNGFMNDFAKAKRNNDENAVNHVKSDIENFKQEVMQKLPESVEKKEIIDSINEYISHVIFELQEMVTNNEKILKERIGDDVTKDSDKDGISDYDEIHLYKTNPFTADTDGDSYIDGAEITAGYDPTDSKSESVVTYETPRETGIVREDLLEVHDIVTITQTDAQNVASTTTNTATSTATSTQVVPPQRALISGKGLPNSFVTLYIYSTPIVVTVKTDDKGSWSYVFDKELEDGAHEVYVGITDNTGRIVAKSNPFPFVKTAEAFTKADSVSAVVASTETKPRLVNNNTMLLLGSLGVTAIGLLLIFLGIHVNRNRKILESTIDTIGTEAVAS